MKQAWRYPWVFAPNLTEYSDILPLPEEEFRHVAFVLRCTNGENLITFDGKGGVRMGSLTLTPKQGFIHFKSDFKKIPQALKQYNLVQFLPNNVATFEIVLRKCCELGIHSIYTVLGERSERKQWAPEIWKKRIDRFQRILIESCKQAKNPYLPKIFLPETLSTINWQKLGCCFHGSLREKAYHWKQEGMPDLYSIIVGPEGGFSENEEQFLSGVSSGICLPTYVLRTETAVVSLITAVKLGDRFM